MDKYENQCSGHTAEEVVGVKGKGILSTTRRTPEHPLGD